jgi:hypothetical protein
MNVHDIEKVVEAVAKSGSHLVCGSCGMETLASGDLTICSNCENIVTYDASMIGKSRTDHFVDIEKIMRLVVAKDFKSAMSAWEAKEGASSEPQMIYSEALFYIAYSNHETSLINYELPGFMEENIAHRNESLRLYSIARLKMNRGIYIIERDAAAGIKSLQLNYTAFLLHVKLGDMRVAKEYLDEIKSYGEPYVYQYALVVFSAATNNFKDVVYYAMGLCTNEKFSIGAVYYIAWGLFKEGKKQQAREVVKILQRYMKSDSLTELAALVGGWPSSSSSL